MLLERTTGLLPATKARSVSDTTLHDPNTGMSHPNMTE